MSLPEPLRSEALPQNLASALAAGAARLGPFARHVHWHPEVPSTNDWAAVLADDGAPEGTIVIAGAQTAGRGRRGRTWHSPPGAGLYLSVVLRPPSGIVPLLTIAAGVAVADGIRSATGLDTILKWPNDVYAASRKLAGILAEAGASAAGLRHVVVGVGINVRPGAYPPDVASRATSLEGELRASIDAGAVLVECLSALAERYDDLRRDRADTVLIAWREYARPLFGRRVEWDERGATHSGVAQDVDTTGALLVRSKAGVVRVFSGEVRWM